MPDPTDPRAEDQDALTHLDLLDPVVVHLNMLRGRIAKLTDAQIRHLHPQLFAGTDPRADVDKDWQVKPLEWEDFDGRGAKATAMLIASYLITRWSDGRFEISVSAPGYSTGFDGERFHPTLEAAKAASQADYDRKILARLTRFVAAHPALGYDPECPECKGTGQRDSGGTHPWGEPAMMMCDCDAPPRAVADESIAEMRIAINRVPLDPALAAEIASEVTQFLDGAAQAPTVADDPSGIVQQMPEGAGDVLAPCPFCGAPAEIVHIDGGELAGGSCVTCTKCLACSNVEFEFKENFVSNWNRRATEADLRAEVERLRGMIDSAANILSNCSVESGVCCCGDAMDNHTAPMHSGHSPVDQGSYITDEWLKSYRALSPNLMEARMKSDLIDLDVRVLHETDKAALVTLDVPDNGVWLPKSKIELSETGIAGIMTVTLPEWLALDKGLI